MKLRSLISIGTTFTFLLTLSGCSDVQTAPEPEVQIRKVNVYTIHREKFTPVLEILGALEANAEVTIAAEISGTVANISVEQGDFIKADDQLLEFETDDNLLELNYQNALINFQNSKTTLDLIKGSTKNEEKNAQIGVEQSEIALKNATVSDQKTDVSLASQIASGEKVVEVSKSSLQIAQNTLENILQNNEKTKQNLGENSVNVMRSSVSHFRDIIIFSDETLGITLKNEERRIDIPYLSFHNPNLLGEADTEWRALNSKVEDLHEELGALTAENWKNIDTMGSLLSKTHSLAGEFRGFLDLLEDIAANTTTSTTVTEQEISSFSTSIDTYQTVNNGTIAQITGSEQAITDFQLTGPQNIHNAELSVSSAQSQLAAAEQNLIDLKASNDVRKTGTSSAKEVAEKSLEAAKNQLEAVKDSAALRIQSAEAQYENAQNQLAQASLQIGKLEVHSPIKGMITTKNVEEGDTVNAGSMLFIISDLDTLLLKGSILAEEAGKLKEGDPAAITIDGFDSLVGKVSKISLTAEKETRQVPIEISVDNPKHALPVNILASATITLEKEDNALFIPLGSVISEESPSVFVLKPENEVNTAEYREFVTAFEKLKEYSRLTFPYVNLEKPAPGKIAPKEIETDSADSESTKENTVSEEEEPLERFIVEKREITLGRKNGDLVEVLSGLKTREKIVLERVIGLKEGDIVEILPTVSTATEEEVSPGKKSTNPQEKPAIVPTKKPEEETPAKNPPATDTNTDPLT
jgi:RND family efflux transporter MFP subunit